MSPGYLRSLLKKTSGTTKVNRQAHQLKKDDGTLTTDDTEKATMLNDYFCTVAEKLIRPADEIPPLHAHGRENVDTPTMTSIMISQKEVEEKICKLEVKKATRPNGVSARLLSGYVYDPISHELKNRVLKPASHQTSGK